MANSSRSSDLEVGSAETCAALRAATPNGTTGTAAPVVEAGGRRGARRRSAGGRRERRLQVPLETPDQNHAWKNLVNVAQGHMIVIARQARGTAKNAKPCEIYGQVVRVANFPSTVRKSAATHRGRWRRITRAAT